MADCLELKRRSRPEKASRWTGKIHSVCLQCVGVALHVTLSVGRS